MKKVMYFLVFILSLFLPSAAFSAGFTVSSTLSGSVPMFDTKMSLVAYNVVSDTNGDASMDLTSLTGGLAWVMVRVPATDPVSTGYTLRVYDSTLTTQRDLLVNAGVSLVNTSNYDFPVRDSVGGTVSAYPISGNEQIVLSDMGSETNLIIILGIWH